MAAIGSTIAEGCILTKLRVLHIAETYPPEYGGGAAIYIRDVCQGLASRGHEIRVLSTESIRAQSYTIRTDFDGLIRVGRLNFPYLKSYDPDGWTLGLLGWLRHQWRVARIIDVLLREWRPHLIHYHTTRPLGEECLLAIRRHRIPVVAMLHEAWLICPRLMLLRSPTSEACSGPGLGKCLECLYSHYDGSHLRAYVKLPWRMWKLNLYVAYRLWRRRLARRVLAGAIGYSQYITNVHRAHLPGIVRYLPLGINLERQPVNQPTRPRTPLRFGFIGGFQLTKGIDHILQSVSALQREGLAFEVHVWGPGQEAGRATIAARGLEDRVVLRGMFTERDRWTVYQEMDVALMATVVSEPFGRVPQEAAAVGVPTIAPAVGGITEQIRSGVDGLLYRFRDPRDLEARMSDSDGAAPVAGIDPEPLDSAGHSRGFRSDRGLLPGCAG